MPTTSSPLSNTSAPSRRPRGNQAGVLGPYSRVIDRGARGVISGNTWEGRFLRAYEADLVEYLGGNVSIVQRALITRACRLALHLELMDRRSLVEGKPLTTHDHNHYVAWSNSLARLLLKIGVQAAAARAPNLVEFSSDRKDALSPAEAYRLLIHG